MLRNSYEVHSIVLGLEVAGLEDLHQFTDLSCEFKLAHII